MVMYFITCVVAYERKIATSVSLILFNISDFNEDLHSWEAALVEVSNSEACQNFQNFFPECGK